MSDKLVSNLESFASTVASDVKGINARLAKFNETHALISESETEPTGADKPLFWVKTVPDSEVTKNVSKIVYSNNGLTLTYDDASVGTVDLQGLKPQSSSVADTAKKLSKAVNINGISFDGSKDITIPITSAEVRNNINTNASFIGQIAVVGEKVYIAVGTNNVQQWKEVTASSGAGGGSANDVVFYSVTYTSVATATADTESYLAYNRATGWGVLHLDFHLNSDADMNRIIANLPSNAPLALKTYDKQFRNSNDNTGSVFVNKGSRSLMGYGMSQGFTGRDYNFDIIGFWKLV